MAEVYTIEEAKLKTCCSIQQKCTADCCMAWKFHTIIKDIPQPNTRPQPPKFETITDKTKGYCGIVR